MVDSAKQPGIIRPNELYTLEELKQRCNLGDAAMRSARRAGLLVSYKHGRGFILGSDWIAYIRKDTRSEQRPSGTSSEMPLAEGGAA